jgi:hypothetical protein
MHLEINGVGYQRAGLAKFDNSNNWTVYNMVNSSLPDSFITCLAVIQNSNLLCIGTRNGFVTFDGNSIWTVYNVSNSQIAGNYINTVTTIGTDIWIGTNNGLSKLNNGTFTNYTVAGNGFMNDTVLSIAASGIANKIWVGTQRNLTKLENGIPTNYNYLNSSLPNDKIISLLYWGNRLWIGSSLNGLFTFNENGNYSFVSYNNNPWNKPIAKVNNRVNFIEPYENNSILVPSDKGFLVIEGYNLGFNGGTTYAEVNRVTDFYLNYYANVNSGSPNNTHILKYDFTTNRIWSIRSCPLTTSYLGIFSLDINNYLNMHQWIENGIPLITAGLEVSPENSKRLNVNNINALILNRGDMFWNPYAGSAEYEVPYNQIKNAGFAQTLWLAGLDQANNLHVSAQTYRQQGTDYWPGPLDTIAGTIDSSMSIYYDKIWKISQYEIAEFRFNFYNGLVQNGSYLPSDDFLTWPAQGTGNYSRLMAPFVDQNNNGVYDPLIGGDYPKIKGDQMLYSIFNDNLTTHGESGGLPFKVEVHASAYGYNCPNLPDSIRSTLWNTTFYHFDITNRSSNNYHNVRAGIFNDVDLGDSYDDALRSDSLNNYSSFYNFDLQDGSGAGNSYGLYPPVQSQLILNGPLASQNDGVDNNNNGLIDESNEICLLSGLSKLGNDASLTGNPSTTIHFFNYLNQLWKDSTHLTYGGNGYGGTINTRFAFSGSPADTSSWYSTNAQDVRSLATLGNFNLNAGETVSIDIANITSQDSTLSYNSVAYNNLVKHDNIKIKNWFLSNNYSPCFDTTSIILSPPITNTNYFCKSIPYQIDYYASGTFTAGNVFGISAQYGEYLENSMTIGTLSSTSNAGVITIIFPASIPSGSNLRLSLFAQGPSYLYGSLFSQTSYSLYDTDLPLDFNSSNTNITNTPLTTIFNNNTPNLINYNFVWYFGDGTMLASNAASISHTYNYNGIYSVSLVAYDVIGGCSDTLIKNNYITCNTNGGLACNHSVTLNPSGIVNACVGSNVPLQSSTSLANANYQWNRNGVIIGGASQDHYLVNLSGNYSLTVFDAFGCPVTSSPVQINYSIPSNVAPTITSSGPASSCGNVNVTLTAAGSFTNYLWSNGQTGNSITVTQGGSYTVTGQSPACDVVSLPTLINGSNATVPPICMVTVDETDNKNVVIWEKPMDAAIDSFLVLREDINLPGVYHIISAQAYVELSEFKDVSSDANARAYRYKLAVKDTCGGITIPSTAQRSMHLDVAQGNNLLSRQLTWNVYQGQPQAFTQYLIYRETAPGNLNLAIIDSVPSTQTWYYDNTLTNINDTARAYKIGYRVTTPCVSTRAQNDICSSNVTANERPAVDGVKNISSNDLSWNIMPIPNNGVFTVVLNNLVQAELKMFDITGKLLIQEKLMGQINTVNAQNLSRGTYLVSVTDNNGFSSQKLVIVN